MTVTETILGPIEWDYIDGDIIGQGVLLRGYWPDRENAVEMERALLGEHSDPDHFHDRPVYDWEPRVKAWWFRKVPCSPLICGDHGWHLYEAQAPGPGVFEAVYVDWLFRDADHVRKAS